MIRTETAHKIAAGWYDGDGSALYLLACNTDHSKLTNHDWYQAVEEVRALARHYAHEKVLMRDEILPLLQYCSTKYYTAEETEGDHA